MKDGKVCILCPACIKFIDYMIERYSEIKEYRVIYDGGDFDYVPEPDPEDYEHLKTICPECGAEFENYTTREFLIYYDDERIEPLGYYWLDDEEEFKRVAKKLNLKPIIIPEG